MRIIRKRGKEKEMRNKEKENLRLQHLRVLESAKTKGAPKIVGVGTNNNKITKAYLV